MKKILVINPGSTSTKIGVFEDERKVFVESIRHSAEELSVFDRVVDQYQFRKELVEKTLAEKGVSLSELDAVVSRGGLLSSIKAGAYEINEDMVWQLKNKPRHEHASNVGPMIAYAIAGERGIPAYIYDGITVDEMDPINKITGLPEMRRKGMGHNLNTRAAALRYAREQGRDYKDITVIVTHLGGGISVNLHTGGHIADFINDEEGGFSPERAGGLPLFDVISKCYEDGMNGKTMMKIVKTKGGLVAHLETTSCEEVEDRIAKGDEKAKLIYDAMALNVAKNIAKLAPDVSGRVDAILITGGIAYSDYITSRIKERVEFIAPVIVYPGEDEMQSLANGALRVLRGEEKASVYTRTDNPIE